MQEGFDVATVRRAPDDDIPLQPEFIVLNTSGPEEGKRALVAGLRYLAPHACIIDLVDEAANDRTYDTGADAYIGPPYHLTVVRETMAGLTGGAIDATAKTELMP